jgi:prepilin signal peptidase PulO-like enzyme (type II secretory pathway)
MLYILGIIFVLGLGIGSFLNVILFRMTSEKKFWNGRSECMNCHHILEWYELIPVFSYSIQRGKCRQCEVKLSPQYPLVELLTAILFTGFAYLQYCWIIVKYI